MGTCEEVVDDRTEVVDVQVAEDTILAQCDRQVEQGLADRVADEPDGVVLCRPNTPNRRSSTTSAVPDVGARRKTGTITYFERPCSSTGNDRPSCSSATRSVAARCHRRRRSAERRAGHSDVRSASDRRTSSGSSRQAVVSPAFRCPVGALHGPPHRRRVQRTIDPGDRTRDVEFCAGRSNNFMTSA